MSDMDGFLGKSVIDSIESNKELNRNLDGYKLINQRKINLNQQQQITADREYIRTLEETIAKLKDENHRLKNVTIQVPPTWAGTMKSTGYKIHPRLYFAKVAVFS